MINNHAKGRISFNSLQKSANFFCWGAQVKEVKNAMGGYKGSEVLLGVKIGTSGWILRR